MFTCCRRRQKYKLFGVRRLTRSTYGDLDKFRLNFPRCENRDVAPLNKICKNIPSYKEDIAIVHDK